MKNEKIDDDFTWSPTLVRLRLNNIKAPKIQEADLNDDKIRLFLELKEQEKILKEKENSDDKENM